MAVTRIRNNQIQDSGIWANAKIIPGSITGTLMSSNLVITSDFVVTGNLFVTGVASYTTIASTNTFVNDPLIVFNNAFTGTNTRDIGIVMNRGSDASVAFFWDESADEFVFAVTTDDGTTYGNLPFSTLSNVRMGNLILNNYENTRVLFAGAAGLVSRSPGFTFASNVLTVGGEITITGATATIGTSSADQDLVLAPNGDGLIDASATNLTNLADPTEDSDAVTLSYLESSLSSDVTGIVADNTVIRVIDNGTNAGLFLGNVDNQQVMRSTANSFSLFGQGYAQTTPIFNVTKAGPNANVATVRGAIVATGNVMGGYASFAALNNTPIGNVTASGAKFTDIDASGYTNLAGNVSAASGHFGAVTASGYVNLAGNISAAIMNAGALTATGTTTLAATNVSGFLNSSGNISAAIGHFGTLTTSGYLNLAGNVSAAIGHFGALTATGTTTLAATNVSGYLNSSGNISAATGHFGTLTTSGYLNLSGNLSAAVIHAGALTATGTTTLAATNVSGFLNSSGNISAAIMNTGALNATGTSTLGAVNASGYVNLAGNISTPILNAGAVNATGVVTLTNGTNATNPTSGGLIVSGGAGFAQDVYVAGNLYASNLISTTYSVITVQDPLVFFEANATYPYDYDIGFFSKYIGGYANVTVGTSFFRDDTDHFWKLVSNVTTIAGEQISLTGAFFDGLKIGNLDVADSTATTNFATGAIRSVGGIASKGQLRAGHGIQGTVIGNISSAAGTFTTITASGFVNTGGNVSAAILNTGALNATGTSTLGAVNVSGFLNSSGNISAAIMKTGALTATGTSTLGAVNVSGFLNSAGNISAAILNGGAINSTGFINTTGNVSGAIVNTGALNVSGITTQTGFLNAAANISTPILNAGAVNSTGFINTTGNVSGAVVNAGALNATGTTTLAAVNGSGFVNLSGNISAAIMNTGALNVSGTSTLGAVNGSGYVNLSGNISASNAHFATLSASGYVNLAGNVSAAIVNGGVINAGTLTATGNIIGGLASFAAINSTPVGNATASSGAFTTLASSGLTTFTNATDATTLSAASVIASGGLAVTANTVLGRGLVVNSTGAAGNLHVRGPGVGSSLVYVDFEKNAMVVGGANLNVQSGVVAKFNSTGAIQVPVGTNAQRPGASGNADVAGLVRFNTASAALEFYDGSSWTVAGSEFTVIASQTFAGNGIATGYTMAASSTTAATIVAINGIVQIPTTAYAVSGVTLTFTEAPAPGDVIDTRRLTTTSSVTSLSSADGYAVVDLATSPYANISTGTSSAITRLSLSGADGDFGLVNGTPITYNQTAVNAPTGHMVAIDTFTKGKYTTAEYTISVRNGAQHVQSMKALLFCDGGTPGNVILNTYSDIKSAASLGNIAANLQGTTSTLFFIPANGTINPNVKVQSTYIV